MSTADDLVHEHEALRASRGADDLTTLAAGSRAVASLVSEARAGEAVELGRELVAARTRVQGPRREDTLRERRNWSLALGRSGQLQAAYDETSDLLGVARHALGLRHQLTLTIAADNERWRTAMGLPELDPAPAPEPVAPVNVDPAPPPIARTSIDAASARAGEGWGPDERRAVYKAMGKDYQVVDDELRAEALVAAEEYAKALAVIDDVIPRLRRIYRQDGPHILRMRLLGATCLLRLGDKQGRKEVDLLVADARQTLGDSHTITLEALALQARSSFDRGDPHAVQQLSFLAAAAEREVGNPGAERAALEIHAAEGLALANNGEWVEAHHVLSQVLARAQIHVPEDDPWLLRLRYTQAGTVHRTGDLLGAIALMESVVEDMAGVLGPLDADSRDSREALARIVQQAGDTTRAVALMTTVKEQATWQGSPQQAERADAAIREWTGRRKRFGFGL